MVSCTAPWRGRQGKLGKATSGAEVGLLCFALLGISCRPCLVSVRKGIRQAHQTVVLSHIISQLRPGADLSRVVLPTFILEPRSMLERITKYALNGCLFIGMGSIHLAAVLTRLQLHVPPRDALAYSHHR